MKLINEYITEKLHLNKDMNKENYVLITGYSKTEKYKCEYKIFHNMEETIEGIMKEKAWNNVYKLDDLGKLDKLFKALWDWDYTNGRNKLVDELGAERVSTAEIMDAIKARKKANYSESRFRNN